MSHALLGWGRRALPPLPATSRRVRWALLAIVAVGTALRVVWALRTEQPVELRDPVLYLILSDHLAAGDGFRYGFGVDQGQTAYYPPGYPLALGGTLWLARLVLPGTVSAFDVAVWLNVALSVATIGLVFVLGRRLAGPAVGLVSAGIWALWPNLVFHSGIVLTETLFLFLLVLLLIVLLGDREAAAAPGWRDWSPRAACSGSCCWCGRSRPSSPRSSCCCGGAGAPRRPCGVSGWCWRSPSSCSSRGRSAAPS